MSRVLTESNQPRAKDTATEESAVTVLRQLEEQRGRLFTEAEFQEQRRAVLDELAQGARLRPFTWFTFAVIEVGLAVLVGVGIYSARGLTPGDYTLALVSAVALLCAGSVFWQLVRRVGRDRERTLDERLLELDELRVSRLVSQEEYHDIQSHILNARQHGGTVH